MPIWLLQKTFEADRAQGEPFRLDPSLIRGPLDGPIDTSEWYLGNGIPPFFNRIDFAYFQSGWTESGSGYSADEPQHTLSTDYYYTTFGFRFVNFSEPVEFSFDVLAKSEFYELLRNPTTNDNRPIGNYFVFKIYDCDGGSSPIFSEVIAGYRQKTVVCTIPAGHHCLVFEYKRTWLEQYQWFDETGWRITTVVDPDSWVPVPSGQTADNTVTISNFTPIMDSSIAVYCPASGEAEDTVTLGEINISGYEPEDFAGFWDEWDGEAINISAFQGISELGSDVIEDLPAITINSYPVGSDWSIPIERIIHQKIVYVCILTGSANGLDDYELPCSSLSAVRRNGEPSYLGAVIPNIAAHQAEITARQNGDINIYKGYEDQDGNRNLELIISVNFHYLMFSKGANSQSGTMVGYRQRTYSNPVSRTVSGVSFHGFSSTGTTSLKSDVDLFLNPGDICTYDGSSFTIDWIRYTISPRLAYMEIAE